MFKLNNLFVRSSETKCFIESLHIFKKDVRTTQTATSVREILSKSGKKKVDLKIKPNSSIKWLLLAIPTSTFALGCWQVQRLSWKQGLIKELKSKTIAPPVEFPENLDDLEALEYRQIKVKGTFLHEREILMGPRSRVEEDGAAKASGSFMVGGGNINGYMVITPFRLSDTNQVILVNRGWVPHTQRNPAKRREGQVTEELELQGIVRLTEGRAAFMPSNKPAKGEWFYRDLQGMAEYADSLPVWLDARGPRNMPDGWPVPNQTRVTLRNEHLSYIFTWFSLSAFTSYMWYKKFAYVSKKFCV